VYIGTTIDDPVLAESRALARHGPAPMASFERSLTLHHCTNRPNQR